MDLAEIFNSLPFVEHLGIEVTEVGEGRAEGRLEFRPEHSSVPGGQVAHGGVTYALADTIGGVAVASLDPAPTPTIDMRIDYLSPATDDLHASAEVLRAGGNVATVEVTVRDAEGSRVADATGVYKTTGADGDSPWEAGADPSAVEDQAGDAGEWHAEGWREPDE
jgi:uncharacterized protein (TIGR00369 family)